MASSPSRRPRPSAPPEAPLATVVDAQDTQAPPSLSLDSADDLSDGEDRPVDPETGRVGYYVRRTNENGRVTTLKVFSGFKK